MATVPTDLMERKLREHYLNFIAGLGKSPKFDASMKRFIKEQVNIIESLGGKAARAGVSSGFPAPKRLDLAPWPGKIYKSLEKTAIAAQIATGLNARDSAKAMLAAGIDTSYHRLERLARTETVHAYWQNQRAEAADLGLVLLWSAEDGKRTCKWCLERDGMVADPGASDHPNGRCTLAPTHPKFVKYIGSVDKDGNIYQDKDWDKNLGGVQSQLDVQWKPSMTSSEATHWAADSVIQQTLYHGTTPQASKGITQNGFDLTRSRYGRLHGNGVYLTENPATLAMYEQGAKMKIKVKLKKPVELDDLWIDPRFGDILDSSQDVASAINKFAKEQGFDGVIKRSKDGKIDELIVLDPKNVAVIK